MVEEAILRASRAFKSWRTVAPRQRARVVRNLRYTMVDFQDALAAAAAADTGRPEVEVVMQEITAFLEASRYMEGHYPRWLKDQSFRHLRPGFWLKSNRIQFDGLGVIGVIGPGNFPVSLILMQAVAALLCGNSVLLKPSERCPRTNRVLGQVLAAAELPAGLLEILAGGPEAVPPVVRHPDVRKIIFTGGTVAGREVARLCSANLKPCLLELGGSSPAIVCADANLTLAARGIHWSSTYADGNSCVGTRRVFLVPEVQVEFRRELKALGGSDVEIVGVGSAREAVDLTNAADLRLSASIWSGNQRRAKELARDLQVGIVWINDVGAGLPQMPWGGAGASGWGRLYARLAIPELTHVRCVSRERRFTSRPKFWWYPYLDSRDRLVRRINRLVYGSARRTSSVKK